MLSGCTAPGSGYPPPALVSLPREAHPRIRGFVGSSTAFLRQVEKLPTFAGCNAGVLILGVCQLAYLSFWAIKNQEHYEEVLEHRDQRRREHHEEMVARLNPTPIAPQRWRVELNEMLPGNALVFSDIGGHMLFNIHDLSRRFVPL